MPRRILVVKLSSIGDVIHALPAAQSLRLGHPDAYIAWAVHRSCWEIVEGNRYLDEVFVVEDKSLPGIVRAGCQLAERHFDTAIDMQGLFRSALLAWLSRAPERIGFQGNQEFRGLFTNRRVVPSYNPRPAPYAQMEFAVAAGGPRIEPKPEIFVGPEHRARAESLLQPALDRGGPLIAINPGAAWETKRWKPERYAAVADELNTKRNTQAVIIGGPGDRAAAEAIAGAMKGPSVITAGKTDLKTLAAVLERCALYVGGDTGPMHIAAAMGTPVLAIFGPTDPARTGPVGSPFRIVQHPVPCWPCRNRTCDHHSCMRLVTPADVVRAASDLLSQNVLIRI